VANVVQMTVTMFVFLGIFISEFS